MRKKIAYPFPDYDRRIVSRFLFIPKTLPLPKGERTDLIPEERRWLERVDIEQFYSHLNRCWINSKWAQKKPGVAP